MDRVKSGIAELDEMLHGGFMRGDAVMVAGSAGVGKSTLALGYLVNGATKFGDNGIYVTVEQLPDQIYRDADNFGWDLRKLEEQNKLRIVCTSPNLLLETEGTSILDDQIIAIRLRRMVIDSLSHLAMYVDEKDLRREDYRMIMFLKTKGISSLLIWESPQMIGQTFSLSDIGLSFLVDCILLLRPVEISSALKKALTILKMRGSDHDKQLREFEITPKGVKVTAPFSKYEGVITGSPTRIPSQRFAETFNKAAKKGK